MEALLITIPLSLILALGFLAFFIFSVKDGQFDQAENKKLLVFDIKTKKNQKKGKENE